MGDYKLKVILAVLSGIVFSMIFIIIALVVPVKEKPENYAKQDKAKNRLEEISRHFSK